MSLMLFAIPTSHSSIERHLHRGLTRCAMAGQSRKFCGSDCFPGFCLEYSSSRERRSHDYTCNVYTCTGKYISVYQSGTLFVTDTNYSRASAGGN